jgi:hypothetical protein
VSLPIEHHHGQWLGVTNALQPVCSPVDERLNPIGIMLHGGVTSFMSYSGYIADAMKITLLKKSIGFDRQSHVSSREILVASNQFQLSQF